MNELKVKLSKERMVRIGGGKKEKDYVETIEVLRSRVDVLEKVEASHDRLVETHEALVCEYNEMCRMKEDVDNRL